MQQNIWLIWELTKRELTQRYRGTLLGILWPILYAILFLTIFSFVFSVLLKVRWGASEQTGSAHGSLMIFCGMVPYLFLAEVIGRSPTLMSGAQNLVKRVRFPVQLLPLVSINGAFVIALINLVLLYVFAVATGGAPWASAGPLLLTMIPLYFLALSLGWFLSAIGVFFRDLGQIAPVVVQVMMFMAPVFYPSDIIPAGFQTLFAFNPLTYFVETFRGALAGHFDWTSWMGVSLLYSLLAAGAYRFFARLRSAFGDLL